MESAPFHRKTSRRSLQLSVHSRNIFPYAFRLCSHHTWNFSLVSEMGRIVSKHIQPCCCPRCKCGDERTVGPEGVANAVVRVRLKRIFDEHGFSTRKCAFLLDAVHLLDMYKLIYNEAQYQGLNYAKNAEEFCDSACRRIVRMDRLEYLDMAYQLIVNMHNFRDPLQAPVDKCSKFYFWCLCSLNFISAARLLRMMRDRHIEPNPWMKRIDFTLKTCLLFYHACLLLLPFVILIVLLSVCVHYAVSGAFNTFK